MAIERAAATSSLVDVLDRVLDKGIVIDAWVRLSLVGIELVTVEARVVVASIATYLGYAGALADLKQAGPPPQELTPTSPLPLVLAAHLGGNGHP
jgi:hypothetical protein